MRFVHLLTNSLKYIIHSVWGSDFELWLINFKSAGGLAYLILLTRVDYCHTTAKDCSVLHTKISMSWPLWSSDKLNSNLFKTLFALLLIYIASWTGKLQWTVSETTSTRYCAYCRSTCMLTILIITCSFGFYWHWTLVPSTLAVSNCCCSKGQASYWSNPPFLISDIRALWRSGLSARVSECPKFKMTG